MKVRLRNPDREVEVSGPRRVHDLLTQLEIDPDTVLVIRERTLLTRQERLDEGDLVEIRPVIWGGSGRGGTFTRCSRCRQEAVIELRRHNASFCQPCFERHFVEQVRRAVKQNKMLQPGQPVMVAVSGGKGSLAPWGGVLGPRAPAPRMDPGFGGGD